MKKYSQKSVTRLGITSLILGLLLAAFTFTEFVPQTLNSSYLIGVSIFTVIMGSILAFQNNIEKRQSMIGAAISLGVIVVTVGAVVLLGVTSNFIAPLMQTLLIVALLGVILLVIFLSLLAINGVSRSEKEEQDLSEAGWFLLFGEQRWEKYVFWIIAYFFFLIFLLSFLSIAEEYMMDWKEALILGFLAMILGYLSELRYRLVPEVRAD